jgi:hypothetical protein
MKEEIFKYFKTTLNEKEYLVSKLFVLFSYYGALYTLEARALKFDCVEELKEDIILFLSYIKILC